MSLGIIIINYRTPKVTLDCLASVASQIDEVPGANVILVDNASGDDSLSQLNEAIEHNGWRRWITLIASGVNRGFAGGNNLAIGTLKTVNPAAKYVLLLNSDTILQPHALRYCMGRMDGDPGIGVLSCLLLNPDQSVQNTARKLPTPPRLAAYTFGLPWKLPRAFAWANLEDPGWDRRTQARDVGWVGGAFMFIRNLVLEKIGTLDERFFFYGEDAEFCHRVWKNGWKVRYDPGAAVIHLGGTSTDPTRAAAPHRNLNLWQARYLLQRRCYGLPAEFLIRMVDIASSTLRFLKLRLTAAKNSPELAAQREILGILLHWPSARKGPQ
jgi:N-acetylglucosaminyl-diphospho-decaprenol L-rhamnosyltransferase